MHANHKYSKSANYIASHKVQLSRRRQNPQQMYFPIIKNGRLINKSSLSLISVLNAQKKHLKEIKKQNQIRQQQMAMEIQQRVQLLSQLKKNIIHFNDNLFNKKIVSLIKNAGYGAITIKVWENVQIYQNCTKQLVSQIQKAFEIQLQSSFLSSLDHINNVCRFLLAEYKRNEWRRKENETNSLVSKLKNSLQNISSKVKELDDPKTKIQLIKSIINLKGYQCNSKNKRYLDFKQRAIQKLRQQKIKCQILSAEVFTEGFN